MTEDDQLLTDQLNTRQRVFDFTEKVLGQARDFKARTEKRYEIATWASWFLYALGWGLGLAGRLVGVDGIGGD